MLLIVFFLFIFGMKAQTTLNATGESATYNGNVYAYSIGEMVLVSTENTGSTIYTQGLLQGAVTGLGTKTRHLGLDLKLYPNPVTNIVYLQPDFNGGGILSIKLFDLNGRLILNRQVKLQSGKERQNLDLSFLAHGTYLLRTVLHQNDQEYQKTFKIIKAGKE